MDDFVIVTIDGTYAGDYYVSEESVIYLTSDGLNRGSGTIYLYPSIRSGNNQAYISIASLSYPVYHPASGYNTVTITDIHSVQFNDRGHYVREIEIVDLFLLVTITLCCIIQIFVRRH